MAPGFGLFDELLKHELDTKSTFDKENFSER